MTRPNAWPIIARALWQFVQRCAAEPGDLEEACHAFAAEPATKGFQTGMVTPILNALQPDHFHMLNRKSRTTLNYFTGAEHGHTMLDYPAANAALHNFIDNQPELQQLAEALEMHPGDLFDLFSRWLVSVRNFAFHPTAYWRLTLDDDPALWLEWQEGGYVAMGWDEMGDVEEIGQNEFNARRDSLLEQYPTWRKGDLNQLWRFAHQLHEGDRVIVTGAQNRVLGYGSALSNGKTLPRARPNSPMPAAWSSCKPPPSPTPSKLHLSRWRLTRKRANPCAKKRATLRPSPSPSPPKRALPPMPPAPACNLSIHWRSVLTPPASTRRH
jgi:5-methylcytosine-specific restriction protein B